MQDNLEFLQWTKKFWDQHFPGGDYDAAARRKASGAPPAATGASGAGTRSTSSAARRGTTPTTGARPRAAGAGASPSVAALQRELLRYKEASEGLEKERDFYFAKLRDIEVLMQSALEDDPDLEKEENALARHLHDILYSTEV